MRHRNSTQLSAALVVACIFGTTSLAFGQTDGYFSSAWGARGKGLAGVGTAWPQDALAPALNPAGLVRVGRRFDIDVSLFSPWRSYDVTGAPTTMGSFMTGKVNSERNFFLMPDMGYSITQRDGSVLGLALFGNGGMNTTWPASANGGFGVFGRGKAGVNLEQMFLAATYSKNVSQNTSLGISAIYALQHFSASGLQGFNPTSKTLSDNGVETSTGVGVRLGVLNKLGNGLDLGVAYQPKIKMSRLEKYSGLFADGGNFDIPENYSIGLTKEFNNGAKLGMEVRHIRYSDVPSVGNPMANMVNGLGSPNGPGFGWRDMTVVKLGYEWLASNDLTWRVGVSYGRQPIPSSEMLFNILAPGTLEWHFATGFTKELGKGRSLSVSLTYSPDKTVRGPNPNDPTQTIGLTLREFELTVGYTIKF